MKSTVTDLLERRSSRMYKSEQITDEELETVLEAGKYAPSAMNRQSSVMVVLQDKEAIARLSCHGQSDECCTCNRSWIVLDKQGL